MSKCFRSKLLNFFIENPLKTWWKARKYFKCPRIKFQWGFGDNVRWDKRKGKILDIYSSDVIWKWKYDMIRHEWDPQMHIAIFSCFWIHISFVTRYKGEFNEVQDNGTYYWETLLSYLYDKECKGDLIKTIQSEGYWKCHSKIYDKYMPCSTFRDILTKKGIKILKDYERKCYNTTV